MYYIYLYLYVYICTYIKKKLFVKSSLSKRRKNVVFIYFGFLNVNELL